MTESTTEGTKPSNVFVTFILRERAFLVILMVCFIVAAMTYRTPHIAMWVGFIFAGYSAVANDSIQTLGTFIASNRDQKWWHLWLYIGAIFVATMVFGWLRFDGDISWQRLTSKGFEVAPTSFSFLQVAAPLFLLIITRLRMPVSTSILLLSCFAVEAKGIQSVLMKSIGGYGIAFVASIVLWGTLGRWMQRKFTGPTHPAWRVAQFITTGGLWAVWLAQDAANIAVFLPRQLNVVEMLAFVTFIFGGLGILFYQRGEKVQEVVEEKAAVADVRPAVVIDLLYGLILYYKMTSSVVPMSTTWVFIGLLGGRELALTWSKAIPGLSMKNAFRMMFRDLATVTFGLGVSLVLALTINDVVRLGWFPNTFSDDAAACVRVESTRAEAATLPASGEGEALPMLETEEHYRVVFGDGQTAGLARFEGSGAVTVFAGGLGQVRVLDATGAPLSGTTVSTSECVSVHSKTTVDLGDGGVFTLELTTPLQEPVSIVIHNE